MIGYLPIINAPATELSTIFGFLNQSELQIRKELILETEVVVEDQALFSKAAQIVLKQKGALSNIIFRLGAFHTICNALAITEKNRFKDAV